MHGRVQQMLSGLVKHRNGVGYFADPLGKASLLTHWQSLVEFTYGVMRLRSKQPADLAFAAVEDSGDGVTVGLSDGCRRDKSLKAGKLKSEPYPRLPQADKGDLEGGELLFVLLKTSRL